MTPRQDPEYLETVSLIAENAEQAVTIASQAARIAELEAALEQMTDEFKMDDHNLHYPRCNCQSHQNYQAARALLAGKE